MKKQAILLTYTGTTCPDSRQAAFALLREELAGQFPDFELREAFTSGRIIEKLKAGSGLEVDSAWQALKRAAADGIQRIVVQPLHLTRGSEYEKLAGALREQGRLFEQAVLGEPLLSSEADFTAVLEAVVQRTAAFDDGGTAVCLVGHGGVSMAADAGNIYAKMQEKLAQAGYQNYYVGVLKGKPSFEDVQAALKGRAALLDVRFQTRSCARRYHRVVLLPFMAVAGRHAKQDIAREQAGAWKWRLEEEGYEVACILEGLAQSRHVRELYAQHVKEAVVGLQ